MLCIIQHYALLNTDEQFHLHISHLFAFTCISI